MSQESRDVGKDAAAGRSLNEALFLAWRVGDRAACEAMWEQFHSRLFSAAVGYCRRFFDVATAEQLASNAWSQAYFELDAGGRKSRLNWQGEHGLLAYVRNGVLLRCRDECRAEWRRRNRLIDLVEPEDESGEPLDAVATMPATQEDDLLFAEKSREGLRRFVQSLAVLAEMCRDQEALLVVIEGVREFLRERLIEALPGVDPTQHGRSLSLDDLADRVDPRGVEATKPALYEHLGRRLGLQGNVLYLRMRRLRQMM